MEKGQECLQKSSPKCSPGRNKFYFGIPINKKSKIKNTQSKEGGVGLCENGVESREWRVEGGVWVAFNR